MDKPITEWSQRKLRRAHKVASIELGYDHAVTWALRDELLYRIARDVCHRYGCAWTDPRTRVTYPP